MHVLVKLVCNRCFAMYRSELDAEGWHGELPAAPPAEGICSICGRVEGHRTVQLKTEDVAARVSAAALANGPKGNE